MKAVTGTRRLRERGSAGRVPRNARGTGHDGSTAPLASAALVSFLVNSAYGTAVASGSMGSARIRWLHHALFILTSTMTGLALLSALVERRRAGLALLPAVVSLVAMPSTRGGSPRHIAVAASALPSFVIAALLSRR